MNKKQRVLIYPVEPEGAFGKKAQTGGGLNVNSAMVPGDTFGELTVFGLICQ